MSSIPRPGTRRTSKASAQSQHAVTDERAQLTQHFRDLAEDFQRCLDACRKSFDDLEYQVGCCRTLSDVAALVGPKRAAAIAGEAESYRGVYEQLLRARPLTGESLALICGWNLVPQAAELVVRAFASRYLVAPARLVRRLTFGDPDVPAGQARLREFWYQEIIPELCALPGKGITERAGDPWAAVTSNVVACTLLADLIRDARPSHRATQSSRASFNCTHLSQRAMLILQTLLDLKALDEDRRKSTREVAKRADSNDLNSDSFKRQMSQLVKLGLVKSSRGREGGVWLSAEGTKRATKLANS